MFLQKIDWLTLTKVYTRNPVGTPVLSHFGAESLASDIVLDLTGQVGKLMKGKAARFYPYTFECALTGAQVYLSDDLTMQGVKVTLSGQALERHGDPDTLLQRALLAHWKVTRIDIAVDAMNEYHPVEEYVRQYAAENGEKTNRTWSQVSSPTGTTLYIGSRQSARMLRIYDKGKQQQRDDDWKRFEMEYKDYAAPVVAEKWLTDKRFIYAEIVDMLALPETMITDGLKAMADGQEHEKIKAPVSESNRVLWFKGQVMAAFAKIVQDDPMLALECLATVEETLLEQYDRWMKNL